MKGRALLSIAMLAALASPGDATSVRGRVLLSKGQLAIKNNDAQPDWTTPKLSLPAPPSCSVASSDVSVISLNCGSYMLNVYTNVVAGGALTRSRIITNNGDHFTVADTFNNTDAITFGAHVRNFVGTPSNYVHLGGQLNPAGNDVAVAWNPTAFAPLGASGVGLVIEDDTFRIQGRADHSSSSTVGIKTDLLCLASATSQTLQWSIYPTATNSYWDFINRVRSNWSVNTQVIGPYTYWSPDGVLAMTPTALANALASQNVAVAALGGGWTDPMQSGSPTVIGFGSYVSSSYFSSYRGRVSTAISMLHTAKPGMKVIVYLNWGRDSTPSANTVYGDSLGTDSSNNPITTTFGGIFTTSWNTIPTSSNSYGVAMQSVATAMTALGADGIYIDEMETYGYFAPPWTYNQWDGVSCVLKTGGGVSSQIAEVDLLAQSERLGIASSAGFILGNTPPLLRGFTQRGDMRMVEIETDITRAGYSNLTTPLGYITSHNDWASLLGAVNNAVLPVHLDSAGLITAPVTYQPLPRMFPLTPQYIQPGTLRGSQRIVTARSGRHGWTTASGGGSGILQWRYDSSGQEHAGAWPVTIGGGVFVNVTLAANELAVLQRVP